MIYRITNHTFDFHFYLSLFDTVETVIEALAKDGCSDARFIIDNEGVGTHVFDNTSLACMHFETKEDVTHNNIAHEVHHSILAMCGRQGIKIMPSNSEPTAYLTGWLTERVYKILDKRKIEVAHDWEGCEWPQVGKYDIKLKRPKQ